MDRVAIEKIEEYRALHMGDRGALVLADTLNELGLFEFAREERQMHLKNHTVQVLAKMGVITPGDKYEVLVSLAKVLQNFVPTLEE